MGKTLRRAVGVNEEKGAGDLAACHPKGIREREKQSHGEDGGRDCFHFCCGRIVFSLIATGSVHCILWVLCHRFGAGLCSGPWRRF